jgi:hypothetical protein
MPNSEEALPATSKVFLSAFVLSCLLFWWLPSILFRMSGMHDPVGSWALWMSVVGLGTFAFGFFVSPRKVRSFFQSLICLPKLKFESCTLDSCERLSYQGAVLVALPALAVATRFLSYRLGTTYGQGEGIPLDYQAVLYLHLFLGCLYLGLARTTPENARRILIVSALVALPRLIISFRWGRFFFAQAAVPIIFIALARGWVRLSRKLILSFGFFTAFLIFVPALTRGDNFFGPSGMVSFFSAGSTLQLFQDNAGLDLAGRCPPLLVSLSAKTFPYGLAGVCTMRYLGSNGWPATLDRILANNDPATEGTLNGPGSNYLLELYLTGGVAAIVLGSVAFGFSSRCFVEWIAQRSAFAGIWAECLSRALLAPRSNLGYVYERIPTLVVATLAVLWISWLVHARVIASRKEKKKFGFERSESVPNERPDISKTRGHADAF